MNQSLDWKTNAFQNEHWDYQYWNRLTKDIKNLNYDTGKKIKT